MTKQEFTEKNEILKEKMENCVTMEEYEKVSLEIGALVDEFTGSFASSKLDDANHKAWLIAG